VISTTSQKTGVATLFGYTIHTIPTDSMEDTIMTGDLIICKVNDGNMTFEIGDVVTYKTIVANQYIYKTHRIVESNTIYDTVYYYTQGDNEENQDGGNIVAGDIIDKWNGFRIPLMGSVISYMKSGTGFFVCLVIPVALFFLFYLYKFIKNFKEYTEEKNAVEIAKAKEEMTEEQKQKIIEEYLAKHKDDSEN